MNAHYVSVRAPSQAFLYAVLVIVMAVKGALWKVMTRVKQHTNSDHGSKESDDGNSLALLVTITLYSSC